MASHHLSFWNVVMTSPASSLYETDRSVLVVHMTQSHPQSALVVWFITPILNSNITQVSHHQFHLQNIAQYSNLPRIPSDGRRPAAIFTVSCRKSMACSLAQGLMIYTSLKLDDQHIGYETRLMMLLMNWQLSSSGLIALSLTLRSIAMYNSIFSTAYSY